jgi:hypothetical protein
MAASTFSWIGVSAATTEKEADVISNINKDFFMIFLSVLAKIRCEIVTAMPNLKAMIWDVIRY